MIPHLLTCLPAAGISPRPETRARSQALPRPPGAVRSRTAACGRLRRSPRRRPLCRERAGRVESPGWVWAGIHLQVGDVQLHPFGAVQLHLLSATSESETCSSLRLDAARSREPRSTHDSSPMSVWCTCGAAMQLLQLRIKGERGGCRAHPDLAQLGGHCGARKQPHHLRNARPRLWC